jgi:hypothetical protein
MTRWQERLTEVDRVRQRTDEEVLDRLDQELAERVARLRGADGARIGARLRELDEEWDIERVLIVNASALAGLGLLGSLVRRRLVAFPMAVMAFLLQHGLQGWCPPLALFRRRSVRTRREIDLERYALKLSRGDFGPQPTGPVDGLLEVAARR